MVLALCPPRCHPNSPKPSNHHTCGPQWVIFVSAVWAPSQRQGQPHSRENLSGPIPPCLPTVGQVILLVFKTGKVAWNSWVPGRLWEGQVHVHAPGIFQKDFLAFPPELSHQQLQDTWMESDLTEAPGGA